ncbi:ubiquinone biosynthesis protein UbiJ [Thalassotalea agarivorans]|uniref:Ubiquinone biosynthesis accessory factor UbiJ n=2 Tax=Thalassotalea agarivorans TaxID=349064 RepID=A0A1I0E8E2_THASX|nr:ubiquinone biosynthesis protein UbiJ [Thalassotalea agarivorans]
MFVQGITLLIEKAIAKVLVMNTAGYPFAQLKGKQLGLAFNELEQCFLLSFSENDVSVHAVDATQFAQTDCAVKTSISGLSELKQGAQITDLIKSEQIVVTGDIKIAQQLTSEIDKLNIDWQSEVAKHIGDVAMYKLWRGNKFIAQKIGFFGKTVAADASEYLLHEQKLVVSSSELTAFNEQVDYTVKLLQDIEQRIVAIDQKIKGQ